MNSTIPPLTVLQGQIKKSNSMPYFKQNNASRKALIYLTKMLSKNIFEWNLNITGDAFAAFVQKIRIKCTLKGI